MLQEMPILLNIALSHYQVAELLSPGSAGGCVPSLGFIYKIIESRSAVALHGPEVRDR